MAGGIEGNERHSDEVEVACAPPLVAWCCGFFDAEGVTAHGGWREWATALRRSGWTRHGGEAQQAQAAMRDDREIDRAAALPSEAHEFSGGELFTQGCVERNVLPGAQTQTLRESRRRYFCFGAPNFG
jgi:hypothetical protein